MTDTRITDFTESLKGKERELSYFVWKTAKNHSFDLTSHVIEDVLSDAYLTAATKMRHQKELVVNNYLAWFYRIVYFTTLDNIKVLKKNRGKLVELKEEMLIYEIADEKISFDSIKDLINDLNKTEKRIIELKFFENLTSKEIAKSLSGEYTAQNVRQIKSRAIKKLLKNYKQ